MNTNKRTILLVEDIADIRFAMRMALEMEGFVVQEAEDGIAALLLLDQLQQVSLIVLDLFMPRMNGFVFLEHVKKDLTHPRATVPIIVFSAAANIEQLASADLVLKKPVDLTVFFDAVHRYSYGRAT